MGNLRDRKISAIKTVKTLTNAGLRESKHLVDTVVNECDKLRGSGAFRTAEDLENTFLRLISGVVIDDSAEENERVKDMLAEDGERLRGLLADVKGGLARSEHANKAYRDRIEELVEAHDRVYSELTKAEDQRDSALETIVMLAKRVYQ